MSLALKDHFRQRHASMLKTHKLMWLLKNQSAERFIAEMEENTYFTATGNEAEKYELWKVASKLKEPTVLLYLLKNQPILDPHKHFQDGGNLLHLMTQSNYIDNLDVMGEIMKDGRLDPNCQNRDGHTPLSLLLLKTHWGLLKHVTQLYLHHPSMKHIHSNGEMIRLLRLLLLKLDFSTFMFLLAHTEEIISPNDLEDRKDFNDDEMVRWELSQTLFESYVYCSKYLVNPREALLELRRNYQFDGRYILSFYLKMITKIFPYFSDIFLTHL